MMRFAPLAAVANGTYTVLTVGDSWGDTGPTYKIIEDAFGKNGVAVNSKNRAVGGTTACEWASKTKSDKTQTTFAAGQGLVNAAEEEFGDEGPDFVWYTLGGNDMAFDGDKPSCMKAAQNDVEAKVCMKTASDKAKACTKQLLDPFFARFPNSKLLQINYDVPCENRICDSLIVNSFLGGAYCKGNKTCHNSLGLYWSSIYVEQLQKEYPQPQYTGLNIFGTVQQANGIEGASPGSPVLSKDSGECGVTKEIMCIHPAYGTPMATAIGDQFWSQFFSKYVASSVV